MKKMATKNYGYDIYALDQGMVSVFLIEGKEKALMVDTGVEACDLLEWASSVTKLPVELCLTHSDHDHIANVDLFDRLYIHSAEADRLLKNGKAAGAELIFVDNGDEIDLGERKLEVVYCPGHTPGSIALLDREHGILFSGDTVSYGPVYMFGEGREDESYIATLKRLKALYQEAAFDKVYPCHNDCPIDGSVIDELIECAEGIRDGVLSGTPSMKFTSDCPVLEYRNGRCGIYHI